MAGSMKMMPKMTTSGKPTDITLSDGRVVKSVQCTPTDEKVWTRVITLG